MLTLFLGFLRKKGVIPNNCHNYTEIKYVKDISIVGHLSSVNLVKKYPNCCHRSTSRGKATQFWEKWESLEASLKVVTVLREGYTLPFRFRPNLTRSPTVVSSYTNPRKKLNLLEALSPAYTNLGCSLSRTRLASEQGKVRTGPKTCFQLRRLPGRPKRRQGQTHTRVLVGLDKQDSVNTV